MAAQGQSSPLPTALPAAPDPGYFTPTQWAIYLALAEAALPAIVPQSKLTDKANQIRVTDEEYQAAFDKSQSLAVPPTRAAFDAYLSEPITQNAQFLDVTHRMVGSLSLPAKKQFAGGLSLLATRLGAYILTGSCVPLHQQPLHMRQAVLQRWKSSWFTTPRLLFKSITILAKATWCRSSPFFLSLSGYPSVPEQWRPGPTFPFEFIQLPSDNDEETAIIETEVLIVGSGCGGGVVARHLAKDRGLGSKVLVVEKGYHFKTDRYPMDQVSGPEFLYENKGFVSSDDNSVNCLAGSCWGGGGTVNWSVMLKTQNFVRREWAKEGLDLFESAEYEDTTNFVWNAMGTDSKAIRHNPGNNVVLRGSHKLGWKAEAAPQNCKGKEHYCGQCHLGCFSADKQGPANFWLPDAAKAGARFMEGLEVEKVIFDDKGAERTAVGVEGTWTSRDPTGETSGAPEHRAVRRVRINAKKVILSSGSLWTPVLLRRSGLQNPKIGKNLHLHPCHHITAKWPHDRRPWEGGIITAVCKEFENMDGEGHGVKVETSCMVPYSILAGLPWTSGLDLKLQALKYRQMSGFITLTRDRDSGCVVPDPTTGKPRIKYTPSVYDRAHALQGVEAVAKLCYVTGAEEIFPFMTGMEPFVRTTEELEAYASTHADAVPDPEVEDPRFSAWLRDIKRVGNEPPFATIFSAHQMGSCRMSVSPGGGVVDMGGRVWGTKGLYVADASVFPSASGVNPMATNMAIAHCIAKGIGNEMESEGKQDG